MGNVRSGRTLIAALFAVVPVGVCALMGASYLAFASVPPVPVPSENPITEPKRILGKMLFFDEQLSSSNVVSCATCHTMSRAGAERRLAINPGPDGIFGSPDDRAGSPGIIRSDTLNNFLRDPVFNFQPQVTGRAANSPINAAFFTDLFWEGRARSQFIDPETGAVAIAAGGALESQAVGPPLNSVEMGHDNIDWTEITAKLVHARPLELASNLPGDLAARLSTKPTYPQLFAEAFGDPAITARRIAFAIATYQRTLISDQSPFDAHMAGVPNALTPGQQAGLNTFQANCAVCHDHSQGLFTDNQFRNIGVRPPAEDRGRQIVTGLNSDRGKFKTPGLRNVGLKQTFMHNGQFSNLTDVVRFYVRAPGAAPQFLDNLDPLAQGIAFPPQAETALVDFLANALLDPRVRDQQFPFDRPTLFSERPADRPMLIGGGVAGAGGIPNMIAQGPAFVGNQAFRLGVFNAPPGAQASCYVSTAAPVGGVISTAYLAGSTTTGAAGGAAGVATITWPINPGFVTAGQVLYAQWVIADPTAPGGLSRSTVAQIPVFCGPMGCPSQCATSDFDGDGDSGTDADIEAFFACMAGNCCPTCWSLGADFDGDGDTGTDADIEAFFRVLAGGAC